MALFRGLFVNKKTGETPDVPSNLAAVVSKTRDKDGRIELQINVATPEDPQAGGTSTAASTADILATLTNETSNNINAIVNSYEDLFDDEEDSNAQRADSEEPDDEVICNRKITGNSGQVYTQRDIYNAQLSLALLRQTRNVLDMNHSHLKPGDVRNKDVLKKYNEAIVTLRESEAKAINLITDMKSSTQFNWVRFLKTHAKKQQQLLRSSSERKGKTPKKSTSSSDSNKKTTKNSMHDTTVPIFNTGDPDDDPSSSDDSSDEDSDDEFEDARPQPTPRKRTPSRRTRSRDASGHRRNDMPLIKFDGKEDVAGWIHQMELTQDDMGWSDRQLCRVALRCLDKTAAVWLQTLHKRGFTFSSWKGSNGLRKRMETRFGECTKGVGRTYQTMLQRSDENAEHFYDRASQAVALRDRKWKRSYEESQRDLCGVLLGGFPQNMLDAIGEKLEDQSDPDKMLRLAKAWEKKKGKKPNSQQGQSKKKSTNATNSDKNWCRRCPDADHLWKDCPKRNKTKKQPQQDSAVATASATAALQDFEEDFQL